ncbi:MAG: alpha-L-fucosidase [Candidatus Hydrogenedentes bacterium]|nr:alpha-L-fucosidase [Candidatus Hydrogenedentota bacterium]
MRRKPGVLGIFALAVIIAHSETMAAEDQDHSGEKSYLRAAPEDMAWWRAARFGMFIHWGPVSLKGTEIGWSRGVERRGTGGTGAIPVEIYDNLYKEFNPTQFDANEWVAIAQAAGMKYMIFTSKHHDGFVNFDSKLTDYKITSPESPFRRDIVKELADACHEAGLRFGFYYSPPDWHHPDYRTERHARYIEYLHGQLHELCTNYGRIDVVWFDGLGGTAQDWDSENLFKMIRELQPHVLINNRAGLPGDFGTPEQEVGGFQIDSAWESCITMGRQWAWKPDDEIKTPKECIQTLVYCAGGDGNLLFNVGPMPTGEIEPRQVERLREMGAWLKQYGESVYSTRGGPFRPGPWGASTHRGNIIYVHVFQWDGLSVTLPPIEKKILLARRLSGTRGQVGFNQNAKSVIITLPLEARQEIDTVIALELDGPAAEIAPRSTSHSVTVGKKATASNVFQNMADYTPDKAVDDNGGTRWATDGGTHAAWLEIDLGEDMTFDHIAIDEAIEKRVQVFELQCRSNDAWRTFFKGTTIGRNWTQTFEPVTARHVRLNILDATEGPTMWEFHLFPPTEK